MSLFSVMKGAFRTPLAGNNTTVVEKPIDINKVKKRMLLHLSKDYRSRNNGKVVLANLNFNSIPYKGPIIFNAGCMGGVEFSNPQFFFVPIHNVTKNFRTHTTFF